MLFEDFDKKIKEAAEQHHPAYDEKAWDKMEKLLDEHLPQPKDNRRRIILFFLLFLLVGGGMYLTIAHPWSKNSQSSELTKENKVQAQPNNKQLPVSNKDLSDAGAEKINSVNNDIDNSTKNPIQQTKQSGQLNQSNTNVTNKNFSAVKKGISVNTSGQSIENNGSSLSNGNSNNHGQNNIAEAEKENTQTTIDGDTKSLSQPGLNPIAPTVNNKPDQNVASNEKKTNNDLQTSAK